MVGNISRIKRRRCPVRRVMTTGGSQHDGWAGWSCNGRRTDVVEPANYGGVACAVVGGGTAGPLNGAAS